MKLNYFHVYICLFWIWNQIIIGRVGVSKWNFQLFTTVVRAGMALSMWQWWHHIPVPPSPSSPPKIFVAHILFFVFFKNISQARHGEYHTRLMPRKSGVLEYYDGNFCFWMQQQIYETKTGKKQQIDDSRECMF